MSLSQISLPDFSGAGVLITGASTGIGAELARAFGAQGAKSVCTTMRRKKPQKLWRPKSEGQGGRLNSSGPMPVSRKNSGKRSTMSQPASAGCAGSSTMPEVW